MRDPIAMPLHSVAEKKPLRLDDEMQFIRSWIEKPLSTGAVMPSSKALARTMARHVDPHASGPVIELGPGTGPVTEALVKHGVDPARLVLVEFNSDFCRLLRARYPAATVVQGDAYRLRRLLTTYVTRAGRGGGVQPAADDQAAAHAPAADFRRHGAADAERALRAIHLRHGAADPEGAVRHHRASLRADLAEPAAGARVGLSRGLSASHHPRRHARPCAGHPRL